MSVKSNKVLRGPRAVLFPQDEEFPQVLKTIPRPPQQLYVLGDPWVLQEGLAIVGARKATPYGISCARHFAEQAAEKGIVVISGGARGCDSAAHQAALACGAPTVVFLGGGCDEVYPKENKALFQRIVDAGGAIVSEYEWTFKPLPFTFRERNRLIAGLARATLIVEAGLPSGTFSTADEALAANKDVLVVPGSIASPTSRGANRLIYQGAIPIVDDETFSDQLFALFGCLKQETYNHLDQSREEVLRGNILSPAAEDALVAALQAQPLGIESLCELLEGFSGKQDDRAHLLLWLAHSQRDRIIAQYPDGRYGPIMSSVR